MIQLLVNKRSVICLSTKWTHLYSFKNNFRKSLNSINADYHELEITKFHVFKHIF